MKPRSRLKLTIALTLGVLITLSTSADEGHDHGEVSNEAKYRHTVMEAMGSQFGAMALILTNRVNRPEELVVHAVALALLKFPIYSSLTKNIVKVLFTARARRLGKIYLGFYTIYVGN